MVNHSCFFWVDSGQTFEDSEHIRDGERHLQRYRKFSINLWHQIEWLLCLLSRHPSHGWNYKCFPVLEKYSFDHWPWGWFNKPMCFCSRGCFFKSFVLINPQLTPRSLGMFTMSCQSFSGAAECDWKWEHDNICNIYIYIYVVKNI